MDGISKISDITDSWIRGLNNQYQTLPAVVFDYNNTLGIYQLRTIPSRSGRFKSRDQQSIYQQRSCLIYVTII